MLLPGRQPAPPHPRIPTRASCAIGLLALAAALLLAACPDIPNEPVDPRDRDTSWPGPDDPNDIPPPSGTNPPNDATVPSAPDRIPPTGEPLLLDDVHRLVLRPECGSCHIDRSPPAGTLFLGSTGLDERLLAPSRQAPDLPLVSPGEPERSYLLHKVNGTHPDVGGDGDRCPVNGPPLDDALLDLLHRWITDQPAPDTLH